MSKKKDNIFFMEIFNDILKINDNNDLLKKFVDLDSMISCCDYFDFIKFGLDNNKPGILSIIESFCYDDFRNDISIVFQDVILPKNISMLKICKLYSKYK